MPKPDPLRPGGAPIFEDRFEGDRLDPAKWLPLYLPHWSEPARTAPSYEMGGGTLRLYVAPGQPPWCPEFDGEVRVSSIQTGHFSGPVGSGRGQHRFRDGLVVRSELPERRLFVPRYCRLEMRARAMLGPDELAALWLIGFEDRPGRSGEITLMEVFGREAGATATVVGHGIKKIRDPRLRDEFHRPELPIRAADWHLYALDWRADGVAFRVDGEEISRTSQSPGYPMQVMLNIYRLPGPEPRREGRPGVFEIDFVRAFAPPG